MKVKPVQEIEEALAPVAAAVGVEIYEVVFKQGKNPSLTVYLDTEAEGGDRFGYLRTVSQCGGSRAR